MPTDHDPAGGISTRLTSPSAVSADPPRVNDYDSLAEAYSAENEANLVNAYYERPAMLALAGDVTGRRILDAGCGSGPLFAALRDRGAIVTGFDNSAGMLELARRRLGDGADLRVADLGDPLPFPDGTFDDVVASLVLHYLEDWGPTLTELRRVLTTGGRLIVSVDHPFAIHAHAPPGRAQDQLFRDLQLDRRVDHGRPDRPDELLEPAAARDDRARQIRRRRAIVRGTSRGSLPACLGRNRHGRRGCGSPGPSGSCPLRLGNRRPV